MLRIPVLWYLKLPNYKQTDNIENNFLALNSIIVSYRKLQLYKIEFNNAADMFIIKVSVFLNLTKITQSFCTMFQDSNIIGCTCHKLELHLCGITNGRLTVAFCLLSGILYEWIHLLQLSECSFRSISSLEYHLAFIVWVQKVKCNLLYCKSLVSGF